MYKIQWSKGQNSVIFIPIHKEKYKFGLGYIILFTEIRQPWSMLTSCGDNLWHSPQNIWNGFITWPSGHMCFILKDWSNDHIDGKVNQGIKFYSKSSSWPFFRDYSSSPSLSGSQYILKPDFKFRRPLWFWNLPNFDLEKPTG